MSSRSVTSSGPDGKDLVIVATKEELATPSTVVLPEPAPAPGLILADGSINWGCPCLGGMATGPCGMQFRDAFSCFHYSDAEPKGSDCYEKFSVMQQCMSQYPELYGKDEDDELAAAIEEAAEPRANNAETQADIADSRTDNAEARGESAMSRADNAKSRADNAEQREGAGDK